MNEREFMLLIIIGMLLVGVIAILVTTSGVNDVP